MKEIQTPQFANYEEEAAFWDTFDTSDYMPDDEWLEVETDTKRPIRVTILRILRLSCIIVQPAKALP
ncbi:MAG: hypothetical protein R3E79_40075 [Caldilineaceae bacterium]